MAKPVCQVKTYTAAVLDHTITDCALITYKDTVTNAIGTFQVALPSTVPHPLSTADPFNDIAPFDKVYIYLGYDTVPANPTFIGRVDKIDVTASSSGGVTRILSGLALGEVLIRRLKNFWRWTATDANVLVDELADDLLLGVGDIDGTLTQHVTYDANQKTYLTLLQNISDYWVNAGSQVKADFKVDDDNDLFWEARPFRPPGTVETLTVGTNILSYRVLKSLEEVRNKIWVYGAFDKENVGTHFTWAPTMFWPHDENWTEYLTNWTLTTGTDITLDTDAADKTTGGASIDCQSSQPGGPGTDDICDFYRNFKPEMNWISGLKETVDNSFAGLTFHCRVSAGFFTTCRVDAFAPNSGNYWTWNISLTGMPNFTTNTITFKDGSEGHVGSPTWNNIQYIRFYVSAFMGARCHCWIDNLRLWGGRFYTVVQDGTLYGADATSIGLYDQRDLIYKDETLDSTTDVAARANTLLYQLKDPPTQVDIVTTGNTNILPGDRLSITIPSEGITAQDFDVLSAVHTFSPSDGFQTAVSLIKYEGVGTGANIRRQIKTNAIQYLADIRKSLQQLGLNREY